jgi:hypothetical protein
MLSQLWTAENRSCQENKRPGILENDFEKKIVEEMKN